MLLVVENSRSAYLLLRAANSLGHLASCTVPESSKSELAVMHLAVRVPAAQQTMSLRPRGLSRGRPRAQLQCSRSNAARCHDVDRQMRAMAHNVSGGWNCQVGGPHHWLQHRAYRNPRSCWANSTARQNTAAPLFKTRHLPVLPPSEPAPATPPPPPAPYRRAPGRIATSSNRANQDHCRSIPLGVIFDSTPVGSLSALRRTQ